MAEEQDEKRPSKRISMEPDGWRGSQVGSDSESEDEERPPSKRLSITRLSVSSTRQSASAAAPKRVSGTAKRVSGASEKRISGASKGSQRLPIATAPTDVKDGFWERLSRRLARMPRIFLITTIIASIVLSVIVSVSWLSELLRMKKAIV